MPSNESQPPPTTRTAVMVIHGGDRLVLNRDVTTEVLVVHRGRTKTTAIDLAGYQLTYDRIVIKGQGRCEIADGDLVLIASDADGDTVLRSRR